MSLDNGYIGSYEHSLAVQREAQRKAEESAKEGRAAGLTAGLAEGYSNGHSAGYTSGRSSGHSDGLLAGFLAGQQAGYHKGWEAAVTIGNKNMVEQKKFTQELKAELEEKGQLIEQLKAKVTALGAENAKLLGFNQQWQKYGNDLKQENTTLRTTLEEFKADNQKLKTHAADLEGKLNEKSQQYNELLYQYNRNRVFLSAVKDVLEDITRERTPETARIQQLFAERYVHHVTYAIQHGEIKASPETEVVFQKKMPNTHKFIVNMLGAAAAFKKEQEARERAEAERAREVEAAAVPEAESEADDGPSP